MHLILEGCRNKNRLSQRKLYEHFYGYGMNITLRYVRKREEAVEVLNDAFLKVFNRIDQYDPAFPFKGWFRKIVVNAAIDHYRAHQKDLLLEDISLADRVSISRTDTTSESGQDLLPVLQKLSPAYRMVFNLYVMEGFKHHEIAERLGISVGASKSNLARAKEKLKFLLSNLDKSAKTS